MHVDRGAEKGDELDRSGETIVELAASAPSTTRSGRTAITADPGAPPAQAIVSPPSVWKVPGLTIVPERRLLRPTKPATKRSAGCS